MTPLQLILLAVALALYAAWLVSKQKPRVRLWSFHEGRDRPINTKEKKNMDVTLATPIAPGFYRECEIGTDEAVDKNGAGQYAEGGVEAGDSSPTRIRTPDDPDRPSSEKLIRFDVMGDGSLGDKVSTLKVDGHVGDGDVPLMLRIIYKVAHKDATEFVGFREGADKPITV